MEIARRRARWPVIVLVAIVAGVAIGLAVDVARSGGAEGWLARHSLSPPYVAAGRRIDVGGRALYLDCRGSGSPTVVLEAGSGSDSATWSAVLDASARITRTCAYDRAGRGRSDPTGPRTLVEAAAELRALLTAAGEPGLYVLVGHSLGGAFVRVFAAEHRAEVVGLVLVDTFDPDLQSDWIHPLLGPLRPEYEAFLDRLRAGVTTVDSLDWPVCERQLRTASTKGLPIDVIRAPRGEPRLDEAANQAIAAAWVAAYESLSPGKVRNITAWGAGHNVQIDRPDLVLVSVRHMVDLARLPAGGPP